MFLAFLTEFSVAEAPRTQHNHNTLQPNKQEIYALSLVIRDITNFFLPQK